MHGPTLTAGGITLRPLTLGDVPALVRWSEDRELRGQIGEVSPMSTAEAAAYLEATASDPAREWYAISLPDGRAIGEAGLLRIFPAWRTADLSVVIGEAGERGKGHGTQAARLLLDRAFGVLGLHRLAVGVVGSNEGALRFWGRLGFRREGVQRDGYLVDGRYHDFVMMSLLAEERPMAP